MESYLIIQAARFGDLVQTKRLILSVQRKGAVHLLVDNNLRDLAVRLYPKTTVHGLAFHGTLDADILQDNQKTLRSLSEIPFARVYNCNYSGLSTAVCRLFDPEMIVGNRPAHPFLGIVRSPKLQCIARLTRYRYAACCNLEDAWAHFVDTPIPASDVNPLPAGAGRGLGVVVAGQESRRSLPPELLAQIIRVQAKNTACRRILLFGTEREKPGAHAIRRALAPSLQPLVTDLCGKTSWADLLEALTGLDCLLSPDTGTMHLAAHLGVPVRAFFLSSASCHETGPYGKGHRVWQAAPDCAPCLEAMPCSHNMACLQAFSNREFIRALVQENEGNPVEPPAGLQCYESDLDDLGCHYALRAGTDAHAAIRQVLRDRLTTVFLGHPSSSEARTPPTTVSPNDMKILEAVFDNDIDWMLEKRYR